MKDVVIEEFVKLKPKVYSFLIDDSSEYKKAKGVIKMLLQQQVIMNIKMLCWIISIWDIL